MQRHELISTITSLKFEVSFIKISHFSKEKKKISDLVHKFCITSQLCKRKYDAHQPILQVILSWIDVDNITQNNILISQVLQKLSVMSCNLFSFSIRWSYSHGLLFLRMHYLYNELYFILSLWKMLFYSACICCLCTLYQKFKQNFTGHDLLCRCKDFCCNFSFFPFFFFNCINAVGFRFIFLFPQCCWVSKSMLTLSVMAWPLDSCFPVCKMPLATEFSYTCLFVVRRIKRDHKAISFLEEAGNS